MWCADLLVQYTAKDQHNFPAQVLVFLGIACWDYTKILVLVIVIDACLADLYLIRTIRHSYM